MKKFALVLLTMTSFSAFAQNLENQIQNKIDRLNRLAGRGDVSLLSRVEKEELNIHLTQALRTLKDNDDRYNPNPRPFPGPRDTRVTALIIGTSKNRVLTLSGRNPGDMLVSCLSEMSRNDVGWLSEIVMTVNDDAYEYSTPRSYSIIGADNICNHLMANVDINRPGYAPRIDISGTLNGTSRTIALNMTGTRSEILNNCASDASISNIGWLNRITVSVNRSGLQTVSPRSYSIIGTGPVCKEIFKVIDQNIHH